MLYNPGIRLASRCGFIPRYTVHLPTPNARRSAPLSFSSRCSIPSPLLGYTATAPLFIFFIYFFFFFVAPPIVQLQPIYYTERWSYPCVRERGVNTFSQSRNWQKPWPHRPQFKKIEWNALYDSEKLVLLWTFNPFRSSFFLFQAGQETSTPLFKCIPI